MKKIIYLTLSILLLLISCKPQDESEQMEAFLNKLYFEKQFKKNNIEWQYENITTTLTDNNIFVDANILSYAKEILQNQTKLSEYYKFLESMNIEDKSLSFPSFNDKQYAEMMEFSSSNGYDINQLRQFDSRNKELYEAIRMERENPKNNAILQKIDCTVILTRGGKKKKGSYTFWMNEKRNKVFKITNNNNKTVKALNTIITNAINENY